MRKIVKFISVFFIVAFLFSCNKKPDFPVCIYPTNGEKKITDSVFVLSWDCEDPNGDKLVFDVFLSEEEEGTLESYNQIAEFYESKTIEVKDLKDNTTYFWQVVAIDPAGKFRMNSWQFTTGEIQH
ncbi:MAG: fibronectin type III domain-containing protein [Bacteroidales bacterium]|nr:fibronectin type III domain-containing protein [Bacteroidales bacterium]